MDAPRTLQEAIIYFADADNCRNFMIRLRWSDGVVRCPHCGGEDVAWLPNAGLYKCYAKHPKQKFSLKVGTIFEDSPIKLEKWLPLMWMLGNSKNGVSSWEVSRSLGVTQKTAWFMLQRGRLAMQDECSGGKIGGEGSEVEVDETFIGGKCGTCTRPRRSRLSRSTATLATRPSLSALWSVAAPFALPWFGSAQENDPALHTGQCGGT